MGCQMTTSQQLREQALTCIADLATITLDCDLSNNQRRDQAVHVLIAYLNETDQARIAYAFRSALVGDFL